MLAYQRKSGVRRGSRHRVLTVVTSANLTDDGLTSNREVLYTEWVPTVGGSRTIALPVLDAFDALAGNSDADEHADRLHDQVAWLRGLLPKSAIAADDRIAHSLGSKPSTSLPRTLLSGVVADRTVTRVALVGPAFADDASTVAHHLTWMLSPQTRVDLVVDTPWTSTELKAGGRSVQVPTRLRTDLQAAVGAGRVHVHAAACDDDGRTAHRTLHAKAIIVETTSGSWIMAGSANITHRGLTGSNRELVVLHPVPDGTITTALRTVRAVPAGRVRAMGQHTKDLPAQVAANAVAILATFTPAAGEAAANGAVRGTLSVTGIPADSTIAVNGGDPITLANGQAEVVLDPREIRLTFTAHGRTRDVLVYVEAPDEDYWDGLGDVDDYRAQTRRSLLGLRHDYARVNAKGSGKGGSSSTAQDGFAIPLNTALVAVARNAHEVHDWPDEQRQRLFDDYFGEDPQERWIADAVVAAASGKPRSKADPLTRALQVAVIEDASKGDQPW